MIRGRNVRAASNSAAPIRVSGIDASLRAPAAVDGSIQAPNRRLYLPAYGTPPPARRIVLGAGRLDGAKGAKHLGFAIDDPRMLDERC